MVRQRRTIVITEEAEQNLISDLLAEAFYPTSAKVLLIKDILDANFERQKLDSLDGNGHPIKEKSVVLMSSDRQPLKTLNMKELLRYLDDNEKIRKMVTNDNDRRKFLEQVITDWYNNRIKSNGILSVNHL